MLFVLGHMFGRIGPEPAAVWGRESTRDEARSSVPECEDAYSRAARGAVPQPTPAAPRLPQEARS